MLISQADGFIAANSSAPIIALVAPVEGAARITQSNSPSRGFHASGPSVPSRPERVTPVTSTPNARKPFGDQRPDRAHADDQRARLEQFDPARRLDRPFVAVGHPHHLIEALGGGEHAHHRIFGDSDRVDPDPVGHRDAALAQEIEREMVEPGVDRVAAISASARPRGRSRPDCAGCMSTQAMSASAIIAVASSADANQATSSPARQMRFEQRAGEGGKDGFHLSLSPPRRPGSTMGSRLSREHD